MWPFQGTASTQELLVLGWEYHKRLSQRRWHLSWDLKKETGVIEESKKEEHEGSARGKTLQNKSRIANSLGQLEQRVGMGKWTVIRLRRALLPKWDIELLSRNNKLSLKSINQESNMRSAFKQNYPLSD